MLLFTFWSFKWILHRFSWTWWFNLETKESYTIKLITFSPKIFLFYLDELKKWWKKQSLLRILIFSQTWMTHQRKETNESFDSGHFWGTSWHSLFFLLRLFHKTKKLSTEAVVWKHSVCFSMNFAKFLRTTTFFFTEHQWWLLM